MNHSLSRRLLHFASAHPTLGSFDTLSRQRWMCLTRWIGECSKSGVVVLQSTGQRSQQRLEEEVLLLTPQACREFLTNMAAHGLIEVDMDCRTIALPAALRERGGPFGPRG